MANSFQDQLLKAGLVDDKKLKKVKKESYKKKKQIGKGGVPESESKRLAQKAIAEKAERDRQLNKKIKQETEQKAIQAQIRQLIEMNRIARDEGDSSYNFVDNNVVKTLHISAELHRQISNGRLAIVKYGASYELVPTQVAEKIEQRDPSVVILRNDRQEHESSDQDPYAEYQIPDDLMW
jgi:uncharacterized protein YaiL (DUF2058 family)